MGRKEKTKKKKEKIKERMAPIKEGDHPEEAEVHQREWPHFLRPLLTGTAICLCE